MTMTEQIAGLTAERDQAVAKLGTDAAAFAAALAAVDNKVAELTADLAAANEDRTSLQNALSDKVVAMAELKEANEKQAAELKAVAEALATAKATLEQPAYGDAKAGHSGPAVPDAGSSNAPALESDEAYMKRYNAAKPGAERNAIFTERQKALKAQ